MIFFRLLFIVLIAAIGYYVFRKLSTSKTSDNSQNSNNDRSPGGQAPLN